MSFALDDCDQPMSNATALAECIVRASVIPPFEHFYFLSCLFEVLSDVHLKRMFARIFGALFCAVLDLSFWVLLGVLSQTSLGGGLGYDRWKRAQRNSMMIEFKGSHFERDVILWGVRWYVAYPISYRQLEEMMEERGVDVDHSTLNRESMKNCGGLFRRLPRLRKH